VDLFICFIPFDFGVRGPFWKFGIALVQGDGISRLRL
jgi:hypothetical protein